MENKDKYIFLETNLLSTVIEFLTIVQDLKIYGDAFYSSNKIWELTFENKNKKEFLTACDRLNCQHIKNTLINYFAE